MPSSEWDWATHIERPPRPPLGLNMSMGAWCQYQVVIWFQYYDFV